MSSQPTGSRATRFSSAVPKVTIRRKRNVDHQEIERMALAEAAYRAAERRDMIATAAYFLAQKRGFEPGHELDDWLTAETEVAHAQRLSVMAPGIEMS